MTLRRLSVVVVSRDRPASLPLTLTALGQQTHTALEIIVVADAAGRCAIQAHPLAPHIHLIENDRPGVAMARNLGISAAAGEIVAFIDDDAVPEPTWAEFLAAAFDAPIDAATGFVRGRNGISFQWAGRAVDACAMHHPIAVEGPDPSVPELPQHLSVKLEGTNMAIRRDWFERHGGFDPGYGFYLDDTDLSLRLRRSGASVAIVPRAEVHHAFAASVRRGADRRPLDLTEIGASLARFLATYARDDLGEAIRRHETAERRRAISNMVMGRIEPRDVGRLMASFSRGTSARRKDTFPPKIAAPTRPFAAIPMQYRDGHELVSGSPAVRADLRKTAAQKAKMGKRVTLFCLSRSLAFHKVRFTPDGYWEHSGGVFGRSIRSQAIFRRLTLQGRVGEEVARIGVVRGFMRDSAGTEVRH